MAEAARPKAKSPQPKALSSSASSLSPRKREGSDLMHGKVKVLDSRLSGDEEQMKVLRSRIHVKHGYPFKSEHFRDEGRYIILTPGNFREAGGFKLQEGKEKFYDAKFPEEYLHECGDLVIAMTEQAAGLLGSMAFVPESNRYLHNQRIGKVTAISDDVHLNFLYYAFRLQSVRQQLSNTASGSKVRHTSPERIYDVSLYLPQVDQQKKIASVLYALDAKIELNNRINAELEALAKTLYDYWFVQFDFPDAKGRPYKTSGGRMVWNEVLRREIPAGWDALPLSSLVAVSTASLNPEEEPDRIFRHLSIPSFDSSGSFIMEPGRSIGSSKFSVCKSDLLVSKLNPWFNRVVADTDYDDLICSTEFVVWRCGDANRQAYLNQVATHPRFIGHCTQSATGTSNSHKRVNPQVMMRYLLPHAQAVADKFGQMARPLLDQQLSNARENCELTQLRDWLLPLLMNGQLQVG